MDKEFEQMRLQNFAKSFQRQTGTDKDIMPILMLCDSYIEHKFLYDVFRFYGKEFEEVKVNGRIAGGKFPLDESEVTILPQHWIGNKRVDFAIIKKTGEQEQKFAIECDSFQHHSKPAELLRDRERDDLYQKNGWKPISLSGDFIIASSTTFRTLIQ
jgi:hypothetical protein